MKYVTIQVNQHSQKHNNLKNSEGFMAKGKMSDAQKEAIRERMRAYHAARRAQKVTEPVAPPETPSVEPAAATPSTVTPIPGITLTNEQFDMLLQRFAGMANEKKTPKLEGVGIIERFPIAAENYKNPVEGLYDLPKLKRFGMRENYVIDWNVTPTKYETRQGQWYMEPRFELTLKKKQFDENGDELIKTDDQGRAYHPRVILGRASFFVDPPADIIEAEKAGIANSGLTDEELREKMFFWRYSMWIEERVSPKKPSQPANSRHEEVIGGRVFQIEDSNVPL